MKLAIVLLAACTSHTAAPIAVEDLDQAYADSECAYVARCGELPDVATCKGAYTGYHFPGIVLEDAIAAIGEGKIEYDGAAARTCVDAIASAPCDLTSQANRIASPACDRIFKGTIGDGAACGLNLECVSGACNVPTCNVTCCTGTCSGSAAPVRAKIGEACTILPCATGAYCESSSQTCTALAAAGATCAYSFQCAYGTGCIGSPKTCQPLPGLGKPCPDGACRDDGLVCNAAKICAKVGLPSDACTTDLDCSHFYGCGASGVCGVRDPGGACMVDSDCFEADTYCAIPLGQTTGTCSPPQADGSFCTDYCQCASDHCEDAATPPTCTPEAVCT